jgi:RND family efflux transporter MFP subunit
MTFCQKILSAIECLHWARGATLCANLALVMAALGCHKPIAAVAQADASTQADESKPRVVASKPSRQTIEVYTVQPARIQAYEESPLLARVAGYVDEIHVDIGDRVMAGQVVARLSAPELLADVRQKEALLAQAAAEVKQAAAAMRAKEAEKASAVSQVASVEAGVQRAAAEHARWQAEFTRVSALADARSVTQKLADETKSQLEAAAAARNAAEAAVAAGRALVDEAQAEIEQAAADGEVAKARLEVARANLSHAQTMAGYLNIAAPFVGVVTRRNADPGHFIEPGAKSPPLFVIASENRLRVFIDVPESQAALAEKGDSATLSVQGLGGRTFEGKITRTSWALDEANRSLRVEVGLENDAGALRPGMYASARILLDSRRDVLALPAPSVFYEADRAFCCVVSDGRIVKTPIEIGLRGAESVEVVSGLSDESMVVVANPTSFADGQSVDAAPPETSKP